MQCIGKSNALTRPRKSGESIHISYIGCEPNVSFGKSIKESSCSSCAGNLLMGSSAEGL